MSTAFTPSLSFPCRADMGRGDAMCMMSGGGCQAPLRFNEPVSNWSYDEHKPITPRWPKAAAAVELGLVGLPAMPWPFGSSLHAWPSMGSSQRAQSNPRPSPRQLFADEPTPRAQSSSPRPSPRLAASPRSSSTTRPSPRQYCDVVMTVKNTFINMAIGRPLSMDDFMVERAAMSCPATARCPMSSRRGERHENVVASAFDKLETAFIEEATSPTSSSSESEDAPADLGTDAGSSEASALPKMEEDRSPITSACFNLESALSAEMKAEHATLTPLRLPIPQREDGQEPLSQPMKAEHPTLTPLRLPIPRREDGQEPLSQPMKAEHPTLTPLRLPIPQREDGQEPLSQPLSMPLSPSSSSTGSDDEEANYGSAAATAMTPSRKQVLHLGDGLIQLPPLPERQQRQQRRHPKLGSRELPTVGSAGHHMGGCKPCAFAHTKGCENGIKCPFCHLCEPGEKKRRQKRRMLAVACQDVHQQQQQQQQAAAAAAATGMGSVMCRPMMSSPVVSRPVLLPSTGWPAGASPTASNAVGGHTPPAAQLQCQQPFNSGAWPVAASLPAARNAIGGWQNPQLRMAAVFNVF